MATGVDAVNPYTGENVPIWTANFVVKDYGTGAVMAVPAHDLRDGEFARSYGLPIAPVIRPTDAEDALDGFTDDGVLEVPGARATAARLLRETREDQVGGDRAVASAGALVLRELVDRLALLVVPDELTERIAANRQLVVAVDQTVQVLARTREIAMRCGFSLGDLRYRYPSEKLPGGRTSSQWLRELTTDGARERYGGELPEAVARQRGQEPAVVDVSVGQDDRVELGRIEGRRVPVPAS